MPNPVNTKTTNAPKRERRIDLNGPLLGLAIFIGLALAAPTVDCFIQIRGRDDDFLPVALAVANKWQSLLGSVFTPLAAVFTGWIVLSQMQDTRGHERDRIRRRWRAQRSAMPMVMSRVCDYAEQSAARLRTVLADATKEEVVTGDRYANAVPVLDESSFGHVVAMVEAADSDEEAAAYQALLHELQVHEARWRGFVGRSLQAEQRFPDQVLEEITDAAEIYARASNLLAQARPADHAPGAPMTRESALFLLGFTDPPERLSALARGYDKSSPLTFATSPSNPER